MRKIFALGAAALALADQLVALRIHGVTPDFVARLRDAGMTSLSAAQLVKLRIAGFRAGS